MESDFYSQNRRALLERLPDDAVAVVFAGKAIRKTADEYYPFFPSRNFVYLTGCGEACAESFIYLAVKRTGSITETLFIQPSGAQAERWTGRRMKTDEARGVSGIENIKYIADFDGRFHSCVNGGNAWDIWLDLDKLKSDEPDDTAHSFANSTRERYPFVNIHNLLPYLRYLRTIKRTCEINAMRKAIAITGEGIRDMMQASKHGMYEYEYKALFDAALTRNSVLSPGFPPIISAGQNNFCIHYYSYTGQANDGDMILNDVGARWDYLGCDISRGWPCGGRFSERQRLLYTCAYNTSEYMFSVIKPGMPMASVDQTARKYCFEQLESIGLLDSYDDIGKYMWHGGAHHVGFDTHDVVDTSRPIAPGMVFCVDIGIYCEEWGIGFRLEDNCLVTETGCENLSVGIPRSIDEIEAVMQHDV
ncbi:Xaa-Pro aminopeptidase [Clostridia bacterium]|nr:Xaa-Pro aminopeptidase [Clostridia bacterium]